jgi:GNAT superfamily N-acetyltransferase
VAADDPVALCAHGSALWHRLGLSALGVEWEERDGVGRRLGDASPVYLGALTLASSVPASALADAVAGLSGRVGVCDSWETLDLSAFGFRRAWVHAWMLRSPAPVRTPVPPGLHVVAARTPADVMVFEQTVFEAADGRFEESWRGTVHPASTSLSVPGVTLFTGWLDGVPVGTSLAAVDGRVVQVSGVAVMPSARRRGVGTALTAAAVAVAPELPAVLDSTTLGHGVYLGLGFRDVGRNAIWERRPV